MYHDPRPRPAIATFFGLTSLLWAIFMLGWVLVVVGLAALIGVGSWLGGPITGVVGTAVGLIIASYCILSSLMSFLLLWAGWSILAGDPQGVSRLRTWAWISVLFDTVTLLVSGGFTATSWAALLYAVAVLYFTRPLEIGSRWVPSGSQQPYGAKPRFTGDPDF